LKLSVQKQLYDYERNSSYIDIYYSCFADLAGKATRNYVNLKLIANTSGGPL